MEMSDIGSNDCCAFMKASDVTDTLSMALEASVLDGMQVAHRPGLLSDNGSSYTAGDLADWLEQKGMDQVRGLRCIIRRRARSSAGTRRSRTAFCSRTTTCQVISSRRSVTSSPTTIISGTTRASVTSPRPPSTSGAGKKALGIGWSQGGGSTIAAAGQPDYVVQKGTARDGLEFGGFVAMAPDDMAAVVPKPTDAASAKKAIDELTQTFSGNVFEFAHFAMMLWGIQAAYPDKLKYTDVYTEEGAKVLDEIYRTKCIHASSDTINYTLGTSYKTLMRPDRQNELAWAQSFQSVSVPNDVKPVAPVMIYFGNNDTTLPPVQHELYRKFMCTTLVPMSAACSCPATRITSPPRASPSSSTCPGSPTASPASPHRTAARGAGLYHAA